jgi:iron-sulfur cluster repair protein YtfE (RIC family)
MSLSYKEIDFSEPIPEMVKRLIREHRELAPKLDEIEKVAGESSTKAVGLLKEVQAKILRHAVQEEARIMRVIMKDAKSESAESIRIMQEHRWVSEFLERRISKLSTLQERQAQNEIQKFAADLRQHFSEEENVVFPLALKAQALEY